MSNNVTSITDKKIDLAALVAEDKKVRGEQCLAEVNESLKTHNCTVNVFIFVGDQKVPISMVVGARIEISIDPS